MVSLADKFHSPNPNGQIPNPHPTPPPLPGNLVVSLADKWQAHVFVCLATYLICLVGRGLIALVAGYGLQLFLALLTESAAAPLGVVIDAAVMASATDEVRAALCTRLCNV